MLNNFSVTELRAQSLARVSRGEDWGCMSLNKHEELCFSKQRNKRKAELSIQLFFYFNN
jgi:hypothetical protein